MIKKLILWLVVIILCVVGILSYVGYRSFNTEAFKEQIVHSIQEATGRTLTVNGKYKLTWDPLPTMTLEQVVLSNNPNSPNPDMFKAESIQIQIEWASLFASPSRIKNVIIVKPNILIERLSRATNNLQFPVLLAAQNKLDPEANLNESTQQPQIDNIQIEHGELHYFNHIDRTERTLKDINGTITMGTLSGPFGFEGNATYETLPLKIKASLGTHEMSQPVNFVLDLAAPNAKAHATLDSQFYPENTDIILMGSMAFEVEKPNVLLESLKQPSFPKKYDTTTVGSMKIEWSTSKLTVSDFLFKVGADDNAFTLNANYTEGTVLQPGQFTLTVAALDLDLWKDTLKNLFDQTKLPNNPLNFDATISQLNWHGQNASALKLLGSAEKNTIHIRDSSVLLPGSTTTQASGRLIKDGENLGLIANIDMQSQNLATALPFFNLPQNNLLQILQKAQKTELRAALEWTPDTFNLEIPALSVNEATGVARFSKQPEQTTEIVLELNNLNLNTYFPIAPDTKPQTIKETMDEIFKQLQTVKLPDTKTHAELVFQNTQWRQTDFQNITIVADTNKQEVNLEAIASTQNQDSLILKTDIQNVGSPEWELIQNKFELSGKNLQDLLQNLSLKAKNTFIQNSHQFNFIGEITGNPKKWQIETSAKVQSATLDLMGSIVDNQPQQLDVRLQYKSIPHLFIELWNKNPLQNLGGELVVETTLSQQDDFITLSDLSIKAGTEYAVGNGRYNVQSHEWDWTLAANTIDLQKVLPDMGRFYLNATGFDSNPFDFSLLRDVKGSLKLNANELFYQTTRLLNAQLQMHIADNTLYIDNLTTTGDGETPSTFQLKGSLNWIKTPAFNLKLITQALPLTTPFAMFDGIGLTGGQMTSEWNLAASGETPLQMVRSLSGNGQISLDNPVWIGADLNAVLNTIKKSPKQEDSQELLTSRFKHALTNGSTPIENIQGNFTIVDGIWRIVAATIETAVADSQSTTLDWDIPTASVQAKVPLILREYATFPSIVLKFLKNEKGVSYTADTSAFITALIEDITQQKKIQQEAAEKAQKEAAEKAVQTAKQETFHTFHELEEQVDFWSKQLISSPDLETQKEVLNAQEFLEQVAPIIQTPDLTQEQYQTITAQTKKMMTTLDQAQSSFTQEQKALYKKRGEQLIQQAQNRISQINDLYQKRPTLTSLSDLIKQADEQKAIMQRALEQYKKPINFIQVKQVATIIQETVQKVEQIYDYAEDVYSGRQNVSAPSTIRRIDP